MTENNSKTLAEGIANYILDKKGKNIRILNIKDQSDFADFFVIATIESDPQAQAVSGYISDKIYEDFGEKPHHREGQFKESNWFILDYLEVVVHLFKPEERKKYNIEKLWFEAEVTEVGEQEDYFDNKY